MARCASSSTPITASFFKLDDDKLRKPFRQRAGLAAPGDDMGGWYDNDPAFNGKGSFHGFIPGHSCGQYLSGLARAYAVTGSKPTQEKTSAFEGFAPIVRIIVSAPGKWFHSTIRYCSFRSLLFRPLGSVSRPIGPDHNYPNTSLG